MYSDYLQKLSHVVVKNSVSKTLEVTKYLLKNLKKPVYFENLSGYRAVGNLWAPRANFAKILNIPEKELKLKLLQALEQPQNFELVSNAEYLKNETTTFSLKSLPIPKYFEKDGGPYITSGIVIAELNNKRNVSFHRMMVLDDKHAVIRLVPRDLYKMYNTAQTLGMPLKFAMIIGADPAFLLAAATTANYNLDETTIASALKYYCVGEREKMVRLKNGIIAPVEAEYVFEGRFIKEVYDTEGPFPDITRTYDLKKNQPIVKFERMYKHDKAVFHILLPGGYEHYNLMGLPREPTIYKALKDAKINVIDLKLTYGGGSWLHGIVKIKKSRKMDGKNAIYAAFKGHKSLKHVVIVDEDIDINNMEEVEWAIATRMQADRDIVIFRDYGSSLDPSRDENDMTAKMGIDATMPLKGREKFKKLF